MATEPSPTADATRLIDRCLTSPIAKTPGILVSGSSGDGLGEPGEGILENEALKPSLPTTVDDLSVKANVDVPCRLDLPDQVVGHARGERVVAHEQRHARGVVRQVRCGLTGRVPSAYNVYLSSLHDLWLSHCGAVEHTCPA